MWRWQKTHAITWSLGAQYHGSEPRVACFREAVQSSRLLHISPSSSMGSSRFHDYWDQFIWDHSFQIIHLRPHSFETCSFETTFIWDLFIWDRIHLRPHSFETTFIWDHSHLRPQSFETAFIWFWDRRSQMSWSQMKWSQMNDLKWIGLNYLHTAHHTSRFPM